jgi:hypothetical protein
MRDGRGYKSILASVCCLATVLAGSAARAATDPGASPTVPGLPDGPPLTPGETPEETYQLNFVGLEHHESGGYVNGSQVSKSETWTGFRGKYRLKLGPIEFYDAVARRDLHDKARTIVVATTVCLATGVALGAGGVFYGLSQADSSGPPKAAMYMFVGGAALFAVALMLRFETVPEAEAYKMARSYNDRLRAHLGLPPIVEDPTQPRASSPPPRPEQRRISLVPALAPQGGGLLVVGSF